MARSLRVVIDPATATTCGDGSGGFCPMVTPGSYGTHWACALTGQRLKDDGGWLQRSPECKAMEVSDG